MQLLEKQAKRPAVCSLYIRSEKFSAFCSLLGYELRPLYER